MEGPFNHVVDCSGSGTAVDWTLTPEETAARVKDERAALKESAARDRRDSAMGELLRRAKGPPDDVLQVRDLKFLLECLGWSP